MKQSGQSRVITSYSIHYTKLYDALASALGEYFERLSTNYFFADFFLGQQVAEAPFVHYPNEQWFPIPEDGSLPAGLLDDYTRDFYDPEGELTADLLVDLQSGNAARGICALLAFTLNTAAYTAEIVRGAIRITSYNVCYTKLLRRARRRCRGRCCRIADPPAGRRSVRLPGRSVITSYSIHYTKLYDLLPGSGRYPAAGLPTPGCQFPDALSDARYQ